MKKVFFNIFNNVSDIERAFEAPGVLDGCEVLFASYTYEDYSGSARVIYRGPDGRLYEVTGSHCSCNGLEEQWQPGEVTLESLAMRPGPDSYDACEMGKDAAESLMRLYGKK